eukprot:403334813
MNGSKISMTTLKNIVLLSKNVEKTSNFFSEIIGLKVIHLTPNFSELKDQKDFRLIIKQTPSLAYSSYGYSPILNFELTQSEDFEEILQKAQTSYNCTLDGEPINDDQYMRIACLRLDEGLTISLTQVINEHQIEKEFDLLVKEEGASVFEKESGMDPKKQELRRLFDSIKL